MIHNLKTHLAPFEAVWSGLKTAEFRLNDRDFKAGDHLILEEYDETTATYRGRVVYAVVTHAAYGPAWGIPAGHAMLSMRVHHVITADGEPHRWLDGLVVD